MPNTEFEFSVYVETKILVFFRLDQKFLWLGRESENDNVKLK